MLIVNRILLLYLLIFTNCLVYADTESHYLILAKISADAAAKKVIRNNKDRVLGVRKQMINGREVYIIKVLSPDTGRIKHYKVDAETGAVL